uniref:Uncharacterized protein n=1 Tax=Rhizophora mucronata TaxID=61149 RepID=A0A2P2NN04_RHIMU
MAIWVLIMGKKVNETMICLIIFLSSAFSLYSIVL